jgi:hypothetical protein
MATQNKNVIVAVTSGGSFDATGWIDRVACFAGIAPERFENCCQGHIPPFVLNGMTVFPLDRASDDYNL